MLTPKQEPRDETIQEIQYPNLENFPNQNLNLNLSLNLDFVSQALEQPTTTTAGAGTVDAARMAEIFRRSFTEGLQRQIQNNDAVDENPNANARAIVPVSASESNYNNAPPAGEVVNVRKHKELVRMTDVGLPDQRQFRDVVRRTRMVYDSVRVLAMAEEEGNFNVRRVRSDLKASATMRSRGLWLNRDKRIVGAIPGICIGDVFLYRMELCVVGLHGQDRKSVV